MYIDQLNDSVQYMSRHLKVVNNDLCCLLNQTAWNIENCPSWLSVSNFGQARVETFTMSLSEPGGINRYRPSCYFCAGRVNEASSECMNEWMTDWLDGWMNPSNQSMQTTSDQLPLLVFKQYISFYEKNWILMLGESRGKFLCDHSYIKTLFKSRCYSYFFIHLIVQLYFFVN